MKLQGVKIDGKVIFVSEKRVKENGGDVLAAVKQFQAEKEKPVEVIERPKKVKAENVVEEIPIESELPTVE